MRAALGLVLAALALLPAASAHIALTVTPPTAPMPVGQTTDVDVAGGAECADIFLGVPPPTSVERTYGLSNATPPGMKWSGDTVTWSASGCVNPDEPGTSHSSGKVHLTPDGSLPAFADLPFEVVCDECEDGSFTAQVGYAGAVAATPPSGIQAGLPFTLVLNVSANYDTDLALSAAAGQHSSLSILPSTVQVDSPLLANQTWRLVPVALQATATGAGWTTDHLQVTVQPSARGHPDAKGNATVIDLTIAPAPAASTSGSGSASASGTGHTSHATGTTSSAGTATTGRSATATSTPSKGSPPASPFLAFALIAAGLAWTRRR